MSYDKGGKPAGFLRLIIRIAEAEIVIVIGDGATGAKGRDMHNFLKLEDRFFWA